MALFPCLGGSGGTSSILGIGGGYYNGIWIHDVDSTTTGFSTNDAVSNGRFSLTRNAGSGNISLTSTIACTVYSAGNVRNPAGITITVPANTATVITGSGSGTAGAFVITK